MYSPTPLPPLQASLSVTPLAVWESVLGLCNASAAMLLVQVTIALLRFVRQPTGNSDLGVQCTASFKKWPHQCWAASPLSLRPAGAQKAITAAPVVHWSAVSG